MKTIYSKWLLLFLIFLSAKVTGQIPNNGFEIWNTSGICLQPEGWAGINDWLGTTENCYGMFRSSDHYPPSVGNYSIQIENNLSILPDAGAYGMIWTGDSTGFGTDQPAFAIEGHPNSLCGYFKFEPQNGDTMDIHFVLYKNGEEITSGKFFSNSPANNWTPFVIPVTDPSYTEVDSARILISCFNSDHIGIYGNSILWVDNLSFDNLISDVVDMGKENAITFLELIARSHFTVRIADFEGRKIVFRIYNSEGKQVYSVKSVDDTQLTINTSKFPAGLYTINLITEGNKVYEKKIVLY